jgi:hypothetical protein
MHLRKPCRRGQEWFRGSALTLILRSVIASEHFSDRLNIELVKNRLRSPQSPNDPSRVITRPSAKIGQNEVLRGERLIATVRTFIVRPDILSKR